MNDRNETVDERQVEIEARLRVIHQKLIEPVTAPERASPVCPPRARVIHGLLTKSEESHVLTCASCRRWHEPKPGPGWLVPALRPVWFGAGTLLALLSVVLVSHCDVLVANAIAMALRPPSVNDLSTSNRVGEQTMVMLDKRRAKLIRRVGAQAAEDLDRKRLTLAEIVGPKTLVKLEDLKVAMAARVSPATLEKLEALKIEKARLVKPPVLIEMEKDKLKLSRKVPEQVLLQLEEANVQAGKVCGRQALVFAAGKQLAEAGSLDNVVLVELARKYGRMAVDEKLSPKAFIRELTYDYESERIKKEMAARKPARKGPRAITAINR